jgi:hypothetical protein
MKNEQQPAHASVALPSDENSETIPGAGTPKDWTPEQQGLLTAPKDQTDYGPEPPPNATDYGLPGTRRHFTRSQNKQQQQDANTSFASTFSPPRASTPQQPKKKSNPQAPPSPSGTTNQPFSHPTDYNTMIWDDYQDKFPPSPQKTLILSPQ